MSAMIISSSTIKVPDIAPTEIFKIGNFIVTNTMISALVTTLILIGLAAVVRIFFIPKWRNTYDKKSGFRIFLEYMVNMFDGNAKDLTGHNSGFIGPVYFALAGFVCLGTLVEVFGLRPPTSDLSLTLAMGLITFVLVFSLGFRQKKARRLLHYLNPIYTISDCIVPFSLALRMFGSVFSGFLIMHLLYGLPAYFLVGIPIIGTFMFTIFHALIQSYIYMFISMSFINEATE